MTAMSTNETSYHNVDVATLHQKENTMNFGNFTTPIVTQQPQLSNNPTRRNNLMNTRISKSLCRLPLLTGSLRRSLNTNKETERRTEMNIITMPRPRKHRKVGATLAALAIVLPSILPGTTMAQVPTQSNYEGPPATVANTPTDGDKQAPPGAGAPKSKHGKVKYHPSKIIVKFKDATTGTDSAKENARRQEGLVKVHDLDIIQAEVAEVHGRSVEEVVNALNKRPDVEYAELDYYQELHNYTTEPNFPSLWGLNNTGQTIGGSTGVYDMDINAPEAFNLTYNRQGPVVAVLDTGVDFSHPDLYNSRWVNPGESGTDAYGRNKATNRVDDDRDGFVDNVNGWDFFHGDNTVFDAADGSHWTSHNVHGTHVAGTIAASLNNWGVVGVAPNSKIMALKVCGPGPNGRIGCQLSARIQALQFVRQKGVRITNNSYGGTNNLPNYGDNYFSQSEQNAINECNCLFVAAAGNDFTNTDYTPAYPAGYQLSNIISVAAVNNDGLFGTFTNYGAASVDISAPGVNILSTIPGVTGYYLNWSDGTSMAAPHVTGVAALMLSVNPYMSPATMRWVMMTYGKPAPNTQGYTVSGKLVDARRAVEVAPYYR
jgi:subtilisin family serine protease